MFGIFGQGEPVLEGEASAGRLEGWPAGGEERGLWRTAGSGEDVLVVAPGQTMDETLSLTSVMDRLALVS